MKKIFILIFIFFLSYPFIFLKAADENKDTTALSGLANTAEIAQLNTTNTDIPTIVGNIVGIVLSFVGTLFFILMLYAGFLWMTARGNEQQVQKAKDLIETAIIGLIIIASAYAITAFIGDNIT